MAAKKKPAAKASKPAAKAKQSPAKSPAAKKTAPTKKAAAKKATHKAKKPAPKATVAKRTAPKAAAATAKKTPATKAPATKAAPKKAAAQPAAAAAPKGKGKAKGGAASASGTLQVDPASGLQGRAHPYVEGSEVYHCELSLLDPSKNMDKYYILQIIEDDGGGEWWTFQRWGRTGNAGQSICDGPFAMVAQAKAVFEAKFLDKTGNEWSKRDSFQQKKGKYSFVATKFDTVRDKKVQWQYYTTNDPLGKPDGWYPYDGDMTTVGSAMSNMESYWEQFCSNAWLATRFVESGQFTYKVDFKALEQTNTSSNKTRPIRRFV